MRPRFDSVHSCHLQPKDGASTLQVAENVCVCACVCVCGIPPLIMNISISPLIFNLSRFATESYELTVTYCTTCYFIPLHVANYFHLKFFGHFFRISFCSMF